MSESLTHVSTRVRRATGLAATHVALSLAAVVILVVEQVGEDAPSTSAWVHGVIVAATAVLLLSFAIRASRGGPAGLRRLRISSSILGIALVVVVLIPGAFPAWMRILEAASAVCVLGVFAQVRGATVSGETESVAGGVGAAEDETSSKRHQSR